MVAVKLIAHLQILVLNVEEKMVNIHVFQWNQSFLYFISKNNNFSM